MLPSHFLSQINRSTADIFRVTRIKQIHSDAGLQGELNSIELVR